MAGVEHAKALAQAGEVDEAIKTLRQSHLLEPANSGVVKLLAALYFDKQDFETAEVFARQWTELCPDDAHAWSIWGTALRKLGRLGEARYAQGKALGLRPGYERARLEVKKIRRDQKLSVPVLPSVPAVSGDCPTPAPTLTAAPPTRNLALVAVVGLSIIGLVLMVSLVPRLVQSVSGKHQSAPRTPPASPAGSSPRAPASTSMPPAAAPRTPPPVGAPPSPELRPPPTVNWPGQPQAPTYHYSGYCSSCNGTGTVRCRFCTNGSTPCKFCYGGVVSCRFCNAGFVRCASCDGRGGSCFLCDGRGYYVCPICDGRRQYQCPICDGRQSYTCPMCDGRMAYTCPICEGTGRLVR